MSGQGARVAELDAERVQRAESVRAARARLSDALRAEQQTGDGRDALREARVADERASYDFARSALRATERTLEAVRARALAETRVAIVARAA